MINIYSINLLDISPDSLKKDPDIVAICNAITPEFHEISAQIGISELLNNLSIQSDEVVDLLAWQEHVDFYDSTLPIEQRRQLVQNSMSWHRRKGTPAAVEELISTLFDEGRVVEWYEYGGEPYRFQVITNNSAVTNVKAIEFMRAVNSVKNARSTLEKVIITNSENLDLYYAGALHMGEFLTIGQVV